MIKRISITIPNELNEWMERQDLIKSQYISRLINKDKVLKSDKVFKSTQNNTDEKEINEVFDAS